MGNLLEEIEACCDSFFFMNYQSKKYFCYELVKTLLRFVICLFSFFPLLIGALRCARCVI